MEKDLSFISLDSKGRWKGFFAQYQLLAMIISRQLSSQLGHTHYKAHKVS